MDTVPFKDALLGMIHGAKPPEYLISPNHRAWMVRRCQIISNTTLDKPDATSDIKAIDRAATPAQTGRRTMTSYIFIEKFGPGGTASRNRKVNEIEITDADKHEFRIEVLSGHRMDEAAREFFHAGGADPDAILCTTDESAGSAYGAGPHYWVEQADPDLYIEDLNGDFSYRLKDHPCALIPQV